MLFSFCAVLAAQEQKYAAVDETPAAQGEWGFRPANGSTSALNPPRFSWRPQRAAKAYVVEAARQREFSAVAYRAEAIEFNVHAPARTFDAGKWYWRFRFVDSAGGESTWSAVREFEVPADATKFPFPPRAELLDRVPTSHPRLFVRPEEMATLRARAKTDLKPHYDRLIKAADAMLKRKTPTDEPPLYPDGIVRKSEQWRELWWGARDQTMRTLDPAAQLGFAYQLSGDRKYGEEAKRILLAAARWDPKGSSGYLYNDEAGMPYNYLFARTYSFVNDLLTDAERAEFRRVMTIRGREMYEHLFPRQFWTPYESHRNRAWHFLGEVAIAFHGEIDDADDWLWAAMNVFANVYPVWSDADGGWHEGMAYWRSYLERFSWWADVMTAAMRFDAYQSLPFFAQVGDLPLYAMPPGTPVGGFGDQTNNVNSANMASIVDVFAAQAQNRYWQWYVDAHREAAPTTASTTRAFSPWLSAGAGYIPFVRAARYPKVEAKPPTDLPSSRAFRGVGHAFLNTSLLDARDNVEILFKASPFGTQSHGYDAQNSFQLYAFGQPLLVSSGVRDIYGSDHHANWMWETKSCNNITIGPRPGSDARGQIKHSPKCVGRITAFSTSPAVDFVQGDASRAYDPPLRKFTRSILFCKPDVIVIVDDLETDSPEVFQYRLHSPAAITIAGQADISIAAEKASCAIALLSPEKLELSYTDKFDVPPRERIKLTQYHLTASTREPAARQRFVAVIRPFRPGQQPAAMPKIEQSDRGVIVRTARLAVRIAGDKIETLP
ncbi:MAG: hypothetical protein QOF78_296 [Phycisphaerales bacterium]|jgi:hypothetical protein|nr:hypothetical protein [Phycisphaerales bacterium]